MAWKEYWDFEKHIMENDNNWLADRHPQSLTGSPAQKTQKRGKDWIDWKGDQHFHSIQGWGTVIGQCANSCSAAVLAMSVLQRHC